MAKRYILTPNTPVEGEIKETDLDGSLVEIELKPAVIHKGVEVVDPEHHFSSAGDSDTPWGIQPPQKQPYKPSSRVSPTPKIDKIKNIIELTKDAITTTIIIKAKNTEEVPQGIIIRPIPITETASVPASLSTEHHNHTDTASEASLAGQESCCENCTIL